MAELDYGKFQSSNTPRTVQENEEIELQGLPEVPRDEPLSYENGGVSPVKEEDTSFLTKTFDFMDNITPDDMGGIIRGTSDQWVPEVPYLTDAYRNTGGAVLGAGLSSGEAIFNGIEWVSSNVSMASAAAVSAMPGGVQTLTWDEAHEVSFGQAVIGSLDIEIGKATRGDADFGTAAAGVAVASMLPFAMIAVPHMLNIGSEAKQEGFDIKEEGDRKAAFETDGASGKFITGFADAVAVVATDPTIALGGAGTFVRTGIKGGRKAVTSGLTRKRILSQEQVALHSNQINVATDMINGAPGATQAEKIKAARNTEGWPAEGEAFVYAMEGDALALQNSVYVTGSNKANQKKIVDILKDTSIEDPTLSAATLKVLTGDVSAWGDVRKIDVELYDRLASINKIESIKGMRLPDGTYPPQTPDGIAVGDDLIADARGYQEFVADPAVQEAYEIHRIGMIDEVADSGEYLSNWRGQVTNGSDEATALKEEFFLSEFNPMRDGVQTGKAASIEAKSNPALKWLDQEDSSGLIPMHPVNVGSSNPSNTFAKNGTISRKELMEIADQLGPEEFHVWMRTGQTSDNVAGPAKSGGGADTSFDARIGENAGRLRDGNGDPIPGWEGVPNEWLFGTDKSAKRIAVPFAEGGSEGRGAAGAGRTQAERKQHYIDVQDDMIRQPFEDQLDSGALDDALDKWMVHQRSIERPKFMPEGTQVPAGYDEATEVISRIHVRGDETALNLVNQGGNHMSAKAAYLANAWRKGKATSTLGTEGKNAYRSSLSDGKNSSGWVVEALERTSASRPINVIRWGGKGTAPGFVMLKGLDGERGNKQAANWLRTSSLDARTSTRLFNEFVDAASEGEKAVVLAKMEVEDLVAQAAKLGIGPEAAKTIAANFAAARGKELASARKTKELYSIDEMGEMNRLPEFMRETNSAVPMMDSKEMGHVLKQNAEALRGWKPKAIVRRAQRLSPVGRELPVVGKKTTDIMDEINSAWKVSVLLRLGYTQRNLGEGALRALATQGYLALNHKALMNMPRNTFHRTEEISSSLAAKRAKKQLIRTQKMLDNNIAELKAMGGRTKAEKSAKADQRGVIQELMDETVAIKEKIDGHLVDAVASRGKRRLTGEQRSKFQRENGLQATFEGPDGTLYRDLSSAEATTRRTLDAGANREIQNVTGGHDFVPMDPATLSAVDMGGYWDEFVLRINDKYMSDTFAQRVLAMNPDGSPKFTRQDHIDWINTSEGNAYFREVKGGNYVNESERASRMGYVDTVIKRLDNELPLGEPRALYARNQAAGTRPTSLQVEKAFDGRDLPTIPGRKVDLDGVSLAGNVWEKYKALTSAFMKGLGTVPETKLLRHPFYDNAYQIRQKQLYRLNAEQGVEMTSSVKASINKAAHSSALAQTNDVMYTILEMSNFAESLRFISPFFASFENSIKTWSKIIYANPALIGISDKVYNIPNNLGLVYDDEGNQVAHSNILRDNDTFIVMPDLVQDFFTDNDIGSGEKMKFRQQGTNFVFPGEQAWWPGLGPMSTLPTALLLRGKPETAEIMKQNLGEGFYREFVPMANPNTNLAEYMMPTWARKLKQMTTGNEDGAYASLKAQMITDAYIKAQIDDVTITEKDLKRVEEEANKFWTFQIGAALTAPWQSQRESPYALQRQGWRKLIEDDSIPYDQKVLDFVEEYGTDFLAVTRGRTNNVTGLDANTQVFNNVKGNRELVGKLEFVNPKLVGMLANIGSDEAPYSQAVSQEFSRYTVNGNRVKENLSSVEVLNKNEIGDGWRLWTEMSDMIDGRLRELNLSSVNLVDPRAKELKAIQESERARISALYPAWGQAQEAYESNLGDYIYGLRTIVADEKFNELQPKAAQTIGMYLNLREATGAAIRATDSNEEKEAIRQRSYASIIQLRDSNIAFADLFDQFLDRDDFREVSDSGTRG